MRAPSKIWVNFDTFLSLIYFRGQFKKNQVPLLKVGFMPHCMWCILETWRHLWNAGATYKLQLQLLGARQITELWSGSRETHQIFPKYEEIIPLTGYYFRFVLSLFVLIQERK